MNAALAWTAAVAMLCLPTRHPRASSFEEYEVKGAFLYNFTKFVEWPPASFKAPESPLALCIVGKAPFTEAFERALAQKSVHGHPIAVHHRGAEDPSLADCHVAFIASSEDQRVPAILTQLKNLTVLTVGETPDFNRKGGMILLKRRGSRLAFEVNLPAALRARLRISAQLLMLADLVETAPPEVH